MEMTNMTRVTIRSVVAAGLAALTLSWPAPLAAQSPATDTMTSVRPEFDAPMPTRSAFLEAIETARDALPDLTPLIRRFDDLRKEDSPEAYVQAEQVLEELVVGMTTGVESFAPPLERVMDAFGERITYITELRAKRRATADMALQSAERADSVAASSDRAAQDLREYVKEEDICDLDTAPEQCSFEIRAYHRDIERTLRRAEQLTERAVRDHEAARKSMKTLAAIRGDMETVLLEFRDVHGQVPYWANDIDHTVRSIQAALQDGEIERVWSQAQQDAAELMASFSEMTRGIRGLVAGRTGPDYDGLDPRLQKELMRGDEITRRAEIVRARVDSLMTATGRDR